MKPTAIKTILAEFQELNRQRLDLDRQSAKLKVQCDALLDKLTAGEAGSGQYGPYLLSVAHKKVPRCTDWNGLHDFIRQEGAFELLHKRLTETAVMERINNGSHVPGIVVDEKVTYKVEAA